MRQGPQVVCYRNAIYRLCCNKYKVILLYNYLSPLTGFCFSETGFREPLQEGEGRLFIIFLYFTKIFRAIDYAMSEIQGENG